MNKELEVTVNVTKTPLYYIGFAFAWAGERITDFGLWIILKGIKTKLQ